MIATKEITTKAFNGSAFEEIKGTIKYSDKGKLLVDEKGTKYITAWEKENVTETNEDIDKATFDEVMREFGVSIHE